MASRKDYTGNKYGYLTAIGYAGKGTRSQGSLWVFQCDCGNERELSLKAVTAGRIKTCGKCQLKHKLREESTGQTVKKSKANNLLFQRFIRRARNEGKQWALTHGDFCTKIDSNCAICGNPPSLKMKGLKIPYNEIQLVDVLGHYTNDNSLSVCKVCNLMAGKIGISQMIEHVIGAYHNLMPTTLDKVND